MMLYNTLSRRKEPLAPLTSGRVSIYQCGPTVYDDPHLGHARAAVIFDVLARYLKVKGYQVTHVRNVTDVDDKIIARAGERHQDFKSLANHYLDRYRKALRILHVAPPSAEPKASDYLHQICANIAALIRKGHAYCSDGDVYFSVASFADYGCLSGRSGESGGFGRPLASDGKKKDPADFALWKSAQQGSPCWPSPWGAGRPGWHIECSTMSACLLGAVFDIHAGGADLIFPHHENEIAQSVALFGKIPARLWLHHGLVTMKREKISKSRGDHPSLFHLLDRWPADVLRLFLLSKRYRHPLSYSSRAFHSVDCQLKRLQRFFRQFPISDISFEDRPRYGTPLWERFCSAMDDDFNVPLAMGVLFGGVKDCNRELRGKRASSFKRSEESVKARCLDIYRICEVIFGWTLEPAAEASASRRHPCHAVPAM